MEQISKEVVKRIIDSGRTREQMIGMVECAVTFDSSTDCISREAVLEINESHHGQMPNEVNHQIWKEIKELPSVRPKDDFEEIAEDIDMMEEDIDLACDALVEDEDCISRSDALDALGHGTTYTSEEIQSIINSLPGYPYNKWIRISKKTLPEDETRVLTTIHARRRTVVRSGLFYHGMFHNDNGDSWKWNDKHILAWKPLDEPHLEENE